MGSESLFDLFDLRHTDALNLALADTIAVEDDLRWKSTIVALERFKSTRHARLQIPRTFLADLILDDARGPVGCGRLIHRGCQS